MPGIHQKNDRASPMVKVEKIHRKTRSNGPVHVTDTSFDSVVKENPVILIDFFAEWCGPCRALAPVIERLSESYYGRVFVAKFDVDKNPRIPCQFQVSSIPTILIIEKGKEVDRIVGCSPHTESQIDVALKGILSHKTRKRLCLRQRGNT